MNKDLINITKGTLLVLSGVILGEMRYKKEDIEVIEILLNALPVFLIVAGLHFWGKSLSYHLRCFQIKYRREIARKEQELKNKLNNDKQ